MNSSLFLNQIALARRWGLSETTLERWRCTGEGPRFLKLGKRVLYRINDVEAHEAKRLRSSTSDPDPRHDALAP